MTKADIDKMREECIHILHGVMMDEEVPPNVRVQAAVKLLDHIEPQGNDDKSEPPRIELPALRRLKRATVKETAQ